MSCRDMEAMTSHPAGEVASSRTMFVEKVGLFHPPVRVPKCPPSM